MQVYDLAWSPTGEYIITGSTDNIARVFTVVDGKCVQEIAEHAHYVQGVAWDPLNEYIATQSSDRSMHIYRISTKQGIFEAHAVGKNTRIPHRHSRTPSIQGSRPPMFRSQSIASDCESVASEYPEPSAPASSSYGRDGAPLTPASGSSMFPPPSIEKPSSRRSSFSGSNAPGSPATYNRYGRSPSPMPPLPAIANWVSIKLYGDESHTNFFRRLTFSPDGGLLMTPAGQFEDPSVVPAKSGGSSNGNSGKDDSATPARGRKGRPSIVTADLTTAPAPTTTTTQSSTSSVYIYSRANFARPPVAQLPGHKKASVAVRFSPVLYELRPGVEGSEAIPPNETKAAALEKGAEGAVDVDVVGPVAGAEGVGSFATPQRTPSSHSMALPSHSQAPIYAPSPRHGHTNIMASPAQSPLDLRPPTPAASKPPTPNSAQTPTRVAVTPVTVSIFALPYRMLFAVVTMDTVAIYDTQQAGPVCLLTKLHYDEFTDLTWSPDGQCLIVSSRDGYCTLITFDEILPAHHTQQHTLQLQSIAHHHSVPISTSSSYVAPTHHTHPFPHSHQSSIITATPSSSNPKKRSEPPLTPAASVDGRGGEKEQGGGKEERDVTQEPPKKKRRVALTRVGDLEL
ncbi:hypothetical protein DXG03_008318 [Asterophora parasitica]|uniref:CAF1B/HIR1 beta-propeller domain-containing protein n=1 Tax=Asterophora parasitica TaxID=117018 RepID=A0A9P7KE50_9AGAR|nr:hypothetical protein DXG03_008318 [Asterophora parasitica]